jgi:hypothetical protein
MTALRLAHVTFVIALLAFAVIIPWLARRDAA